MAKTIRGDKAKRKAFAKSRKAKRNKYAALSRLANENSQIKELAKRYLHLGMKDEV